MITPTTTTAATIQTSLPSGSSSAAIPTTVRIEHAPRPVPVGHLAVYVQRMHGQGGPVRDLPPRPVTVLVAGDDDREVTQKLLRELTTAGYELRWVASPEEAARAPYAIVSTRALGELAELRHDALHDGAHRPPQPRALPRPAGAEPQALAPPGRRVLLRRPVLRPRSLQARQRLARPHRRRPPADGGREADRGGAAARRHRRPPRRRRVHAPARGHRRRARRLDRRRARAGVTRRAVPRGQPRALRVGQHRDRAGHARARAGGRGARRRRRHVPRQGQGRRDARGVRRGDARARDAAARARDRPAPRARARPAARALPAGDRDRDRPASPASRPCAAGPTRPAPRSSRASSCRSPTRPG